MNEIIPAILPKSFDDVRSALGRIEGAAPLVQIDICDGQFVHARTWPLNPTDRTHFAAIVSGTEGLPYWESFNFEVDLMVQHPETQIASWIAAGVTRAIVHLKSHHDWAAIKEAAGGSLELGLGIDLTPDYELLHGYVPQIDFIQIMGIAELGVQGQELDERIFAVLARIRAEYPDVTIQIDGGVTLDNARRLLDAGADALAVGSKIIQSADPKAAIADFQNI